MIKLSSVIIVGAGAAGLFAAGIASEKGDRVTIIEHTKPFGKKILITGKGRCNVTNNCDVDEFLKNVRSNPRFLYSALNACPPSFVMDVFQNKLCVPLKTERGRRVFPVSDRAADILGALSTFAQSADIITAKAQSLIIKNGKACGVKTSAGEFFADKVIVATGGVSYKETGSTGDGYILAQQAGHSIMDLQPSLVSLVEKGNVCKKMMGLSLKNVVLSLYENGKCIYSEQGEMLFTHFGVSGPLVLSASAHIKNIKKNVCSIKIDLKPALSEEKLEKRVMQDFEEYAGKDAANCLVKLLPQKMREVMVDAWGIDKSLKTNQITKEQRRQLIALLKAFPVELKEKGDLAHAVITSGGVNVKEIDPKTMQSKILPNLYFAGEVLDVDAYTGGYNLQIAFATAFAAARN